MKLHQTLFPQSAIGFHFQMEASEYIMLSFEQVKVTLACHSGVFFACEISSLAMCCVTSPALSIHRTRITQAESEEASLMAQTVRVRPGPERPSKGRQLNPICSQSSLLKRPMVVLFFVMWTRVP